MSESKRPEDYENPYEYRRDNLWKVYPKEEGDDRYANIISYFVKKDRSQQYDINGIVSEKPFEILYDVDKAITQLQDVLFTKKRTGRVRGTYRKDFLDNCERQSYEWFALMHYLRQAKIDGANKVLLTKQEFAMIAPTKPTKQKRKKG
ncbi:hypothetical protein NVP1084O_080 [Vibrio phage 1.084.O._10N.261.49.F5]|nr:hypothetical protein NVP1084O_080 [Vibrio phage 1.084.O._10N.261.49.F5]